MSKTLRLAKVIEAGDRSGCWHPGIEAAAELRRLAAVEQEFEALKRAISEAEPVYEAQPVAWYTEDHLTDRSATTYDKSIMYRWECKGWPVTPLYTLKGIK